MRYLLKPFSVAAIIFLMVVVISGLGVKEHGSDENDRYRVGAYYYTWYPKNFDDGWLRNYLKPQQSPDLGKYDSSDPKIAEQHISWASQYGVDFFAISYWPKAKWRDSVLNNGLLKAKNLRDIKFCMMIESLALRDTIKTLNIEFDDKLSDRLVETVIEIAEKYFDNPSYLKIDGRPVIIIYLSRNFTGDFSGAIDKARDEMKKMGYDIFLMADEVYWNTVTAKGPYETTEPQTDRIEAFDAITAYNMYKAEHEDTLGGHGAASRFIPEVRRRWNEFVQATGGSTPFVPNIFPGYNDRAVRHDVDHYVIPRQWEKGGEIGSFFSHMFDELAIPFAYPGLNMIMLTSWNEWNEDTAIEPVKIAPATQIDGSRAKDKYTEGYSYTGYGMKYLEIVRDKVVAVAGRVTDEDGALVSNVEVCGWRRRKDLKPRLVACDNSDYNGYYRLSRLMMKDGEFMVGIRGTQNHRSVKMIKDRAIIQFDFVYSEQMPQQN